MMALQPLECTEGVLGHIDVETLLGQTPGQEVAVQLVVIDYQDGCRRFIEVAWVVGGGIHGRSMVQISADSIGNRRGAGKPGTVHGIGAVSNMEVSGLAECCRARKA